MLYQRTISKKVVAIGVGLHSGERVTITMRPAPPEYGIKFIRNDLPKHPEILCHPFLVKDTRLSTTLIDDNVRVSTIEHLMSAFACLGIDNIIVELTAPEIPIMDGSSNSFIFLLNEAGIVEQNVKKKYIKILKDIQVVDSDKWVKFAPFDGYKIKFTIEFDGDLFKPENCSYEIDFSKASYIKEISRARTFGFMHQVEQIRSAGLGLGGTLNNTIIIDSENVLNPGGLRFKDEFVRHKVLDAIGDLYVIGHQIIGAFEGYKSGHDINNKLLRKLVSDPTSWEYVTFKNEEFVPPGFYNI